MPAQTRSRSPSTSTSSSTASASSKNPSAKGSNSAAQDRLTDRELLDAQAYYDDHPTQYTPYVAEQIQRKVGAEADGIIGHQTIRAIGAYQQGHGLEVDGVAGAATLTKMFGEDIRGQKKKKGDSGGSKDGSKDGKSDKPKKAVLTSSELDEAKQFYKQNRSSYRPDVVERIQAKVGAAVDGSAGPNTIQAIAQWQADNGLESDGIAGPITLKKMFGEDIRTGHGGGKGSDDKDRDGGQDSGGGGIDRPNGLAEIKKVFGEAGKNIVSEQMRAGAGGKQVNVRCHKKVAPILKAVFDDIYKDGKSEHIHSYDGCYVYRTKRKNSKQLSVHSWGIAIDINASGNPMGKKLVVSDSQKILAPYFERHGFYWGANFNDAMHFQYCTGY